MNSVKPVPIICLAEFEKTNELTKNPTPNSSPKTLPLSVLLPDTGLVFAGNKQAGIVENQVLR